METMTITAQVHRSDKTIGAQVIHQSDAITAQLLPVSIPINHITPPKNIKSNSKHSSCSTPKSSKSTKMSKGPVSILKSPSNIKSKSKVKKSIKFQDQSESDSEPEPIIPKLTSKQLKQLKSKYYIVKNTSKVKTISKESKNNSSPDILGPSGISKLKTISKKNKNNSSPDIPGPSGISKVKTISKKNKNNSSPDIAVPSGIVQPRYKDLSGSETDCSSPPKVLIDQRFYQILKVGRQHLIYKYEGSVYPGLLLSKLGYTKGIIVKTMHKYTPTDKDGNPILPFGKINPNSWYWPRIDVRHTIDVQDILDKIPPPHPVSSRSCEHHVDKIKLYWSSKW